MEGDDSVILTITEIKEDRYLTDCGPILFGAEDIWQIVEQKPKAKAKSPLSPHELYDAKIEGISQGRQDVIDHPEQFGLQKPAEWNANDKAFIKDCARILDENGYTASAERLLSMFEQKPVQDMEEKEYVRTLKSLIADFLYGKDEIDRGYYQKIYDWLDGRHIKQEPEWSEEDNEMLECVIMDVESAKEKYLKSTTEVIRQGAIIADKELAWLKSRRPQYHGDVTMTEAYKMGKEAGEASRWKPSDGQMVALDGVIVNCKLNEITKDLLVSLYNDLKKL